jgi:hypothetical protein
VKPRWQIIHQEENSGKVSDQVTQRQKTSAKVNAAKHPQEGHHVHNGAQATLAAKYQPKQQHDKASIKKEATTKHPLRRVQASKYILRRSR